MNSPISHLTHRAITDHLAIVRVDIPVLANDLAKRLLLDNATKKLVRLEIANAMRDLLAHAQLLADRRREASANVERSTVQ